MQFVNIEFGTERSRVESIQVRSHEILDIDISKQFVQQLTDMVVDVCDVMASLDQLDGSRRLFDVEIPDKYITPTQLSANEVGIVNLSGIPLTIESQTLQDGDVEHLNVSENQTAVVVEFESDTVQCECLVDITKVGEFFVRVKSTSSANLGSLGFTISTRDGKRRLIKFHSMLQIQNLTQVPIAVSINESSSLQAAQATGWTIAPASTFQVPITHTLALSKRLIHFRPALDIAHDNSFSGYYVTVRKAEGLTQASSTFVKLLYGSSCTRSSIKPASTAPEWHEKHYLRTPECGTTQLVVELWVHHNAHPDMLLGSGCVDLGQADGRREAVVEIVNVEQGEGVVGMVGLTLEEADTAEEGVTCVDLSALPTDGEVLRVCYGCFACALCCEFKEVQDSEEMIELMIRNSLAENEVIPLWLRQCVESIKACRQAKDTSTDLPFESRLCMIKLKPLLVIENLLNEKMWLRTADGIEYIVESGAQITLKERPVHAILARTASTDWSTKMDLRNVIQKAAKPRTSTLADLILPQTMAKTAWQSALSRGGEEEYYLCLCVVDVHDVEKSAQLYKNRFLVARLGEETRRTSIQTSNLWGEYLNYAVTADASLCVQISCVGDSWRGYYLIGSNVLRLSCAERFWGCYRDEGREVNGKDFQS